MCAKIEGQNCKSVQSIISIAQVIEKAISLVFHEYFYIFQFRLTLNYRVLVIINCSICTDAAYSSKAPIKNFCL